MSTWGQLIATEDDDAGNLAVSRKYFKDTASYEENQNKKSQSK